MADYLWMLERNINYEEGSAIPSVFLNYNTTTTAKCFLTWLFLQYTQQLVPVFSSSTTAICVTKTMSSIQPQRKIELFIELFIIY